MSQTPQQQVDTLIATMQTIYHMAKKGRMGHYSKEQTLYEICCISGRVCNEYANEKDRLDPLTP
jgi:hypothetical protein